MNKPNDYDTAQAFGESRKLQPGGYVCIIRRAEERTMKDGRQMLVAVLDVFDGEYKDYFMSKFNKRKEYAEPGEKVKYPNDGIAYLPVVTKEGKTNGKFKAFCKALEQSGAKISWDDKFCEAITHKLLGVVFRREENEYEGNVWWGIKPYSFCSVEKIQNGDFTVPDDYPLSEQNGSADASQQPQAFSSMSYDDVPF